MSCTQDPSLALATYYASKHEAGERAGMGGLAVDKEKDHSQEGKVADVLIDEVCEESNVPPSSQGWLPGLAGHGGDLIGRG